MGFCMKSFHPRMLPVGQYASYNAVLSVAAVVSLYFYWSSSVTVAIVFRAKGIVPVAYSSVLPKASMQFTQHLAC